MHIGNREHSNWDLIANSNKEQIKETKKIDSKFLESLTAEIRANPEVGEGLASKVIKCIDTSQMDTKVLKDFIASLTDTQTLRGQFCSEFRSKNSFVVELFNKFQGSDAELILSLIDAVPHLSKTELNQLLKKAMKTEKMAVVEELLKKEFSIDRTLFHLACEKGMESVVMHMLEKDKRLLEKRNDTEMTPLMIAIDNKQEAVALALIKADADIRAVGEKKQAIIHFACKSGMKAVVYEILRQDEGQLEVRNKKGMTPLNMALIEKNEEIALMLIDQGASIRTQSVYDINPIFLACHVGMLSVVAKILKVDKEQLNAIDIFHGKTLLMHALEDEQEEMVLMLLEQGAVINEKRIGSALIHLACSAGMEKVVSKILEGDEDQLNVKDRQGYTPIMHAVQGKNKSLINTLIDLGADLKAEDNSQSTVLHYVSYMKDMEDIITKIVEKDDSLLNAQTKYGSTPLHVAIADKNEKIALHLIKLGADFHIANQRKQLAIHVACEYRLLEVASLMLKMDEDLLNIKDKDGNTPLMLAIGDLYSDKMAKMLIEAGADLNIKNTQGNTPLMLAITRTSANKMAELLIEAGADLNTKDMQGYNPLMLAITHSRDNDMIKMLIESGADLRATDDQGFTALYMALDQDRVSLIPLMLEKDPELIYIPARIGEQAITPIQLTLHRKHETLAIDMLCTGLAEFTSIQPLLKQARSFNEAKAFIKSNLVKVLDPAQNAPEANPLKVAILLEDLHMFNNMKANLKDKYLIHLNNFNIDSAFIEKTALKVEPKHFAKGSLITEVPATVDFELDKLKDFFKAINFTNPTAPGYKNPLTLRDEGRTTNPKELKNGVKKIVGRIKTREFYMGAPPRDTPELTEFYDKFEAYLKNIGQLIEGLDDPSEKATHLIDIAIIGLHCGGKIGEAASLYRILSGQLAEGYETQVCDALRGYRLGIIEDWATKGRGTGYEVHRFNHYMYLLGKTLHLPEADSFTKPDSFVHITLTPEEALSKFSEIYHTSALIDFTQGFILDSLKIKSTREACVDWIRDHVPPNWQREKYTGILNKIRNLEAEGVSRQEIRSRIQREEGLFFTQGDQDPIEAIKLHRQRDYNNNVPKVEEWRKDFYNPIFAEIEVMGETANFTEYLTSKKITKKPITSQADAKAAVIERRRKDFFFNKPEESNWNEAFYGDLFKAIEGMQSRDDIRKTLQEKGIELEPDRDFENLLEQVRGVEYLSTIFKYEQDKVTGIDRVAVRNMLKQMEVITYQA